MAKHMSSRSKNNVQMANTNHLTLSLIVPKQTHNPKGLRPNVLYMLCIHTTCASILRLSLVPHHTPNNLYIYIYIYEAFETLTIFHVSTIFK